MADSREISSYPRALAHAVHFRESKEDSAMRRLRIVIAVAVFLAIVTPIIPA